MSLSKYNMFVPFGYFRWFSLGLFDQLSEWRIVLNVFHSQVAWKLLRGDLGKRPYCLFSPTVHHRLACDLTNQPRAATTSAAPPPASSRDSRCWSISRVKFERWVSSLPRPTCRLWPYSRGTDDSRRLSSRSYTWT